MITLITPIIAGWLIDIYMLSEPWGLIIGVILGFISVVALLVNITKNT